MKLYRVKGGALAERHDGRCCALDVDNWDALFNTLELGASLADLIANRPSVSIQDYPLLPPLVGQEVWAAGVTYYRSRDARMEEANAAGGGDFYARVYDADRPELFFKGTLSRVVGHGDKVRIRSDSEWDVPEPELALAINSGGRIIGYTIGNDVSSRSIEGANPLYLAQAKVYDRCCALGPGVLVTDQPLDPTVEIGLEIERGNTVVFEGTTDLGRLKRKPQELVDYLFRDNVFPHGCFLLTGTGIVPPSSFTLQAGDVIRITIDPIGTLENTVL